MKDCSFTHVLNSHRSGVLTVLFGCYMTGSTWNCCLLNTCSVYFVQPRTIYSVTLFGATYVECGCVRYNLLPAALAEWLGSFTCYCRNAEVEWIPKWESAQKVHPGEEYSPTTPARSQTHNHPTTSYSRSTTELSLLSFCFFHVHFLLSVYFV